MSASPLCLCASSRRRSRVRASVKMSTGTETALRLAVAAACVPISVVMSTREDERTAGALEWIAKKGSVFDSGSGCVGCSILMTDSHSSSPSQRHSTMFSPLGSSSSISKLKFYKFFH